MTITAKFTHVNLIVGDWKKLAKFYTAVFGCKPVPPERHLSGKWLEDGTGVPNAKINGIHLELPGYDDSGPTLEIFQYNTHKDRPETAADRPGFAHIAFAVDDVKAARDAVIDAGGGTVGDFISVDLPGVGFINFAYVTDPEGNIIELQQIKK